MKKRIVYLDLIKIIAAYLVIFTHTGDLGSKLYVYGDFGTAQDIIYMIMDVFRGVNVPLFFMVSGALLLGREESYAQLFKKHILKYVTVLILISYFYYTVYKEKNWLDFWDYFTSVYSGPIVGLLWFLYAYIGYLLILPFLRKMVRNMTTSDYIYLLIIGVLFKGVIEVVGRLTIDKSIGVACYLVTDSIFYPVMGYFMANVVKDIWSKRYLLGGALLSTICILCSVCMIYWDKGNTGEFSERYLSSFIVIPTLYMFYLLKCIGTKIEKYDLVSKVINGMGNCTFGVYLFGLFLQVELTDIYCKIFDRLSSFPLISCLLYVGVIMLIAMGITYILKKVPVVRKLI